MPLFEAVRLALSQIRAQKLKSFFTLLGVTIGVMFLIAIVSIVNGMGRFMEDDLVGKLIPKNSFELRRRPNITMGDIDEAEWRSWNLRPRLREEDIQPVIQELPAAATWAVYSEGNVNAESRYARPRVISVTVADGDWFGQKNMGVTSGRLPTAQEQALGSTVVVIGEDVKSHFFPSVDPIGRELSLGGIPYQVIGVAEKQGNAFGISLDKFVVTPYNTPAKRLVNPPRVIDGIIIKLPDQQQMQATMEDIRVFMRSHRGLRPSQKDNFSLQTSDSALEFWKKIQGFLVLAGIALPAIGLLVGSIVIMNIMLVAVAERTREIGVRKALGARRRDILSQFLVESTTLAVVGAALGIAVGFGLARLISAVSPLPTSVELWSVVVGVVVGGGVGIISGVYPASRASRLDPVAALRQE
ncbi:MAG: ABC transporter permease [Gemmatimonadetes bacterium]|nr:ABC transporter permease [Gemmatimonadota bacterium]